MKKFLYTLLCFSIFPIATFLLLEISIAMSRKKLFAETRLEKIFKNSGATYQWINEVPHSNKILLLGSSTVKYGLSCLVLNKLTNDSLAFINLATDARDPVETYFILKQIDLADVKAAYFGIDPWIYVRTYYKNRNSYFYLDMDPITASRYRLEHDRQLFLKRYKNFISSFLTPSPQQEFLKQQVPADFGSGTLSIKPKNFDISVYKKFQLDKYGWSDLQFEYLQKIAALCKNKNIPFTAFIPPKRSDYIADYNQHCTKINDSFLGKLKAAGFTSPIIGSYHQLQTYGDSLFADAYHLNGKGQQAYSVLFYNMIKVNKISP